MGRKFVIHARNGAVLPQRKDLRKGQVNTARYFVNGVIHSLGKFWSITMRIWLCG